MGGSGRIREIAGAALAASEIAEKAELTSSILALAEDLGHDSTPADDVVASNDVAVLDPLQVGRPVGVQLVAPRELKRRTWGSEAGRAATIHALAHIEANAVNLALDAIHRFDAMPAEYYLEWARVASEEAQHFELLSQRLARFDTRYGEFDCHDGLWEIAVKTSHDVGARMALVPLVFEARGLDVTPGLIERFDRHGDAETADVLRTVLSDEVGHVDVGRRWFFWICAERQLDPWTEFERLVSEFSLMLVPPFNIEARVEAGFDEDDLRRWTEAFIGARRGDRSA